MKNSDKAVQKNGGKKASPPFDIGSRIRRLREARSLTLRALADKCSLSVNAISLIERGKNSPTVSSLHTLAEALGVGIVELFQDEEAHDSVFVEKGSRLSHDKDGFLMESLGIGLQNQQLEPFLFTLDPGHGGDAPISHPGQEFVYCLKGEVEYHVEEKKYKLKTGDSLLLEATRPHFFKNSSSRVTSFLVVFQAIGASNLGRQLHF